MCGIWGIISKTRHGLLSADAELAQQMMLDTVQRGSHSTGLFMTNYRNPKKAPTGVKCVGGPWNIFESEVWKEVESYVGIDAGAIVGHGRYATKGKVTAENAHPFQHEHITLVHNGTIYGGLTYGKKGDVDVEVDSHALCVAMAEGNVVDALVNIHGPYAIIVHDAKAGCLYISRNKERPLFCYQTKDRFYIMSEHQYLRALVSRYNKVEQPDQMVFFEEDVVYKIDLNEPEKWTRVANVKTIKDKIWKDKYAREEAERIKRQEEFRKNNPDWDKPKTTTTVTSLVPKKADKRKTLIFEVKSIEPCTGGNYKYICEGADLENIYFQTDVKKEDYIGRIGEARISKSHWRDGIVTYFVKHKGIQWDKEEDENPTHGEASNDTGVYFRFANGNRLLCDDWIKRIKHENCDVCDKTFTALDYKTTMLTDDDSFVCKVCASQFHLGQRTTTREELPVNILH